MSEEGLLDLTSTYRLPLPPGTRPPQECEQTACIPMAHDPLRLVRSLSSVLRGALPASQTGDSSQATLHGARDPSLLSLRECSDKSVWLMCQHLRDGVQVHFVHLCTPTTCTASVCSTEDHLDFSLYSITGEGRKLFMSLSGVGPPQ